MVQKQKMNRDTPRVRVQKQLVRRAARGSAHTRMLFCQFSQGVWGSGAPPVLNCLWISEGIQIPQIVKKRQRHAVKAYVVLAGATPRRCSPDGGKKCDSQWNTPSCVPSKNVSAVTDILGHALTHPYSTTINRINWHRADQ